MLEKLKDFFVLPSFDLPPEKEDEIIDKIVRAISFFDLELPAIFFTASLEPIGPMFSQITLLPWASIAEIIGLRGFDYVAFFNKRENIERLTKKLEEVRESKKTGKKNI